MPISFTAPAWDQNKTGSSTGEMWWDPTTLTLNNLTPEQLQGVDSKTAYALAQYYGQLHGNTVNAMSRMLTDPATAAIREMAAKNRELAGIRASGEEERWTQSDKQDRDAWTLLGQHREAGRGQIGAEGTEQRETQQEAADQKQAQTALEALIQMGGTSGDYNFGTGILGTESEYAKELEETRGEEARELEETRGEEERLTLADRIASELGTATGAGSNRALGSIAAKVREEGTQRR